MNIRFTITSFKKNLAKGIFTILSKDNVLFEHEALSGGWGKGHLEPGEYEIQWCDIRDGKGYTLDNFGWFAYIHPLFGTTRTELGVHPDGNVRGSLGCIVLPFKDLNANKKCYNFIQTGLERSVIPVLVEVVLNH